MFFGAFKSSIMKFLVIQMGHMRISVIAHNFNEFIVIVIMWILQWTHVSWVQVTSHELNGWNWLFLKIIDKKYRFVA
jgi:hypothetical protein